jgi:hypothetical protein
MTIKGKRGRRTQKTSLRHKRNRRRALRISRRRNVTNKHRAPCTALMRGGNYETDVTVRTLEGEPLKAANKVVTTVPGYGVMSAAAYLKLKEDLDRNGADIYD